jgi:hypothetical protein
MLLTSPETLETFNLPASPLIRLSARFRSSSNDGVSSSPIEYDRSLILERSVVPTTSRFRFVSSYESSRNPIRASNQLVTISKCQHPFSRFCPTAPLRDADIIANVSNRPTALCDVLKSRASWIQRPRPHERHRNLQRPRQSKTICSRSARIASVMPADPTMEDHLLHFCWSRGAEGPGTLRCGLPCVPRTARWRRWRCHSQRAARPGCSQQSRHLF